MSDVNHDENIYEVTWRLPFWGITEEGLITAPDLLTAVVVAPDVSASGYPIRHVSGPDGELTREWDDDHRLREVDFLVEVEGVLLEERVAATDIGTALDVLFVLADPAAELRGVYAEGRRLHLSVVPHSFWERPDVPDEWTRAA